VTTATLLLALALAAPPAATNPACAPPTPGRLDAPLEGALASFEALPNASMIQVNGEDYGHGVYVPYGDLCIDAPVAAYFLSGTQPPRKTDCAGKSLPIPEHDLQTFLDPVAARGLLKLIAEVPSR
jgi:hypothetical protein